MASYPLYAGYNLANSQTVPTYQGSTNPEMLSVMQHNQGLYDAGLSMANTEEENLDNINALPVDQSKADALRTDVQQKLDAFSSRGDYENLVPAVQKLGADFGKRMAELSAPIQQRQAVRESLENKDLNLTSDQKDTLMAMNDEAYSKSGGLKKDQYGRYRGLYNSITPAKNIDVNKKMDEALDKYAEDKGGQIQEKDGGMWLVKNGIKVEQLSPQRAQAIGAEYLGNDQEYSAYSGMLQKMAAFKGSHDWANPNAFPDMVPGMVPKYDSNGQPMKDKKNQPIMTMGQIPNSDKQYVLNQAAKTGLSPSEVGANMYASREGARIYNTALGYITAKYAHNNRFTDSTFEANPYALEDYKKKLTDQGDFFSMQGPDAKVSTDEADLDKLKKNLTDQDAQYSAANDHLTMLQNRLNSPTLTPDARGQIQTDITATKNQIGDINQTRTRANEIADYSKMRTAQSMGYNSYDDFRDGQSVGIEKAIRAKAGGTFKASDGTTVSASEVAKALVDGKVHTNYINAPEGTTPGGDSFGLGSMTTNPTHQDGIKVTLPSGKTLTISGDVGEKVNASLQDAQSKSRIDEFQDKWQNEHASNVKNYSVSSNYVNLGLKDREDLSNLVQSGAQGVKLTLPGDYTNEIPEGDRPPEMKVLSVKSVSPDGKVTLAVQGYDAKKKPTQVYEATVSNSNIGEVLARKWKKADSAGDNPGASAAAEAISPNSGAGQLLTQPIGGKLSLGTHDGRALTLVTRTSGGRTFYQIEDEKGNIVKNSKGDAFQTTDLGAAGRWKDYLDTQKN
jgi:hypothetical protein